VASVPRELPRGANAPPPEIVLLSQRARMLEAIVLAVAEKGFAAATVADVARMARVSRTTFYENFANKEDCFLCAYEAGARLHFKRVSAAVRRTDGHERRLREGMREYVDMLRREPAYARTFLLEINQAGGRALQMRAEVHRRYAQLLEDWHQAEATGPRAPEALYVGVVGAVNGLVADSIAAGEETVLARLPELLVRLVHALLNPEVDDGE
jgi:AcrR family transcriptional regulator